MNRAGAARLISESAHGARPDKESAMTDDEAQIRALLARMEAGYRAKDAKQVMADFAPDAVMFYMDNFRAATDLQP